MPVQALHQALLQVRRELFDGRVERLAQLPRRRPQAVDQGELDLFLHLRGRGESLRDYHCFLFLSGMVVVDGVVHDVDVVIVVAIQDDACVVIDEDDDVVIDEDDDVVIDEDDVGIDEGDDVVIDEDDDDVVIETTLLLSMSVVCRYRADAAATVARICVSFIKKARDKSQPQAVAAGGDGQGRRRMNIATVRTPKHKRQVSQRTRRFSSRCMSTYASGVGATRNIRSHPTPPHPLCLSRRHHRDVAIKKNHNCQHSIQ